MVELLNDHLDQFYSLLQMGKDAFQLLLDKLIVKGVLRDTSRMTVEE